MSFTYAYARPAVTADVAIFSMRSDDLAVLLIKRGEEPFKGKWALPGGHVEPNESLEKAALRELEEETGISSIPFEQLGAFGDPGRDPRGHYVTVAYYTVLASEHLRAKAGDDASEVAWHPLRALDLGLAKKDPAAKTAKKRSSKRSKESELVSLAFDHAKIIRLALDRVRERLLDPTRPSRFHLAPPHFTLTEIQRVYEIVFDRKLDARAFRRWMLERDFIEPVAPKKSSKNAGKNVKKAANRSAASMLYRFKHAPQRRTIDD